MLSGNFSIWIGFGKSCRVWMPVSGAENSVSNGTFNPEFQAPTRTWTSLLLKMKRLPFSTGRFSTAVDPRNVGAAQLLVNGKVLLVPAERGHALETR
jgi:hypothetical protein